MLDSSSGVPVGGMICCCCCCCWACRCSAGMGGTGTEVGVTVADLGADDFLVGVEGCWGSTLGLAIWEAANTRELLPSRRFLGASFTLGWVWHWKQVSVPMRE